MHIVAFQNSLFAGDLFGELKSLKLAVEAALSAPPPPNKLSVEFLSNPSLLKSYKTVFPRQPSAYPLCIQIFTKK
jgi:hypothetical protein